METARVRRPPFAMSQTIDSRGHEKEEHECHPQNPPRTRHCLPLSFPVIRGGLLPAGFSVMSVRTFKLELNAERRALGGKFFEVVRSTVDHALGLDSRGVLRS